MSWPGRWTPWSGFDGHALDVVGGGAATGHAAVLAVVVAIGDALPVGSNAWTPSV